MVSVEVMFIGEGVKVMEGEAVGLGLRVGY